MQECWFDKSRYNGFLVETSLFQKLLYLYTQYLRAVAFNTTFSKSLRGIFAKIFADAVWYQSLVGTGSNRLLCL
jgi:hypothetical protein